MEKILGIKLKLSEARNNDLMHDYLADQQGNVIADDDNKSQKSQSKIDKLLSKETANKVHNRNLVARRNNDKLQVQAEDYTKKLHQEQLQRKKNLRESLKARSQALEAEDLKKLEEKQRALDNVNANKRVRIAEDIEVR